MVWELLKRGRRENKKIGKHWAALKLGRKEIGKTTRRKLVPYSRPLLEVVPRSQPFVYHGADHLALPSPIPAQHSAALEQLLLQLLREKKTRITVRFCSPTRDPCTRLPQTPLMLSMERTTL